MNRPTFTIMFSTTCYLSESQMYVYLVFHFAGLSWIIVTSTLLASWISLLNYHRTFLSMAVGSSNFFPMKILIHAHIFLSPSSPLHMPFRYVVLVLVLRRWNSALSCFISACCLESPLPLSPWLHFATYRFPNESQCDSCFFSLFGDL